MFKFSPQTKHAWNQIKSTAFISSLTHLLSVRVLHNYSCAKGGQKMKRTCRVALECRYCPQWSGPYPFTYFLMAQKRNDTSPPNHAFSFLDQFCESWQKEFRGSDRSAVKDVTVASCSADVSLVCPVRWRMRGGGEPIKLQCQSYFFEDCENWRK